MDSSPVQLSSIGQIAVPVQDLERATGFYRDTLGMNFIFQVPGMMSFFDCDGVRLVLSVPTDEKYDHPSSIIYFRVDDIQATYASLSEKQVSFHQPPRSIGQMGDVDVWMAFFEDPDGNTMAIMSEIQLENET